MPKFKVIGDYGPVGGMCIEQDIVAESKEIAVRTFCAQVQEENPIEWERMGRNNVTAWEISSDS